MKCVEVNDQAGLNEAAAAGDCAHVRTGLYEASGSATVRASGSATVQASRYVAVTVHGVRTRVTGGVRIDLPEITTAVDWCEFYGVDVAGGVATLYKVVGEDLKSGAGLAYEPGSTPTAPDWDGGRKECGGGLHFSPRPFQALRFASDIVEPYRYIACPVRLDDMRAPRATDAYPDKIKAKGCAGPVYECDIDGEPLPVPAEAVSA